MNRNFTLSLKSLLITIVLFFAVLQQVSADVTVTPASGGTAISADKSLGSPAAAFTTLGDIVIADNASGDFPASTTGNFTLSAPTNWSFKSGTGIVLFAGSRIINASVSVTATSIVVSYTTNAVASDDNVITISGIQVQANVKRTLTSANIQRTSGSGTIAGFTNSINCGSLVQVPGAFVKLQLILQGESAAPGTATGKTGTPVSVTAGTSLFFTINAVDVNWNRVTSVTDQVQASSSGAVGTVTLPAAAALSGGTLVQSVAFKAAGSFTTTVTDITDGSKTANTSPSVTVNAGTFVKLQILLPGETAAPGLTSGKTGTPTSQIAGSSFAVVVNGVDANWNITTTATDIVNLSTSDINAVMPADAALVSGTRTFNVTLKTGGSRTITASDVSNGNITTNTSASLTLNPGTFTKLQLLLPGQSAAPGTALGFTGTATPPARGVSFSITVRATDDNFNLITSEASTVTITSGDGAAVLPPAAALASGTRNFTITLNTAGTQTLTATSGTINTTVFTPDGVVASNSSDHFRSRGSGNWNDTANWESSVNGISSWHQATLTPTSASNTVTILSGHIITLSSSLNTDQVVIASGGQLTISSGITLGVLNGTGTDLDVFGTLRSSGTISSSGATIVFEATGVYDHAFTLPAGVIPTATWTAGSTCLITGYTSYTGAIGGAGQAFSNFVWNAPNQNVSGGVSLDVSNFSATNLTVISTGTGSFQLSTTGATINVSGNLTIQGGTITLNKTSGTTTLNIGSNLNISGGVLNKGSGAGNIVFNGGGTSVFSRSGGTISGAINFTVNSGTTLDVGTSILNGSTGTFTISSGAGLATANTAGIATSGSTGSIQVSGTRTFSTGANYTYNGTTAQVTGAGLPATVANLTISNPSGVTATSAITVNNILNVSGELNMGTNTLTAGTSFSTTGSGTISTQHTTNAFSSGITLAIPVHYNGSAQTITNGTYGNITFSNGTKTFNSGNTDILGTWTSNSAIDLITNSSTVRFIGATQSLYDYGSGVSFKNVIFGNSGIKGINAGTFSVSPTGTLNMSGSANLITNGNLLIMANATDNGNIGEIPEGADISGLVNIQLFITGNNNMAYRGSRSLSPPINDAALGTTTYGQLKNYMYITGAGNVSNGFDLGGSAQPSGVTVQLYNEPAITGAAVYTQLSSISQHATPGRGFFLYFRGNRSDPTGKLNAPYAVPEDVIVTYTGPLNKNTISVSGLTNTHNSGDNLNGYNLVGNPYASTINWATVLANSTNLDNLVVTVKAGGGNASYINGVSNNGGSQYIQTGQAFYVKVSDTQNTGTVNFTESAKANNSPARLLSSKNAIAGTSGSYTAPKTFIRMSLQDQVNTDEATITFREGFSATGTDDAAYISGSTVNLASLSSDNRPLAINFMPAISEVKEIKLSVNATETGALTLKFTDLSAAEGYAVKLKDNFLGTLTDIKSNQAYAFNVDKGNAATFGDNRFSLVMTKQENANQFANTANISVYPNPAVNELNIRLDESYTNSIFASVYSTMGNKIKEAAIALKDGVYTLDVTGLNTGTYIVNVADKSGNKITTTKFIKY